MLLKIYLFYAYPGEDEAMLKIVFETSTQPNFFSPLCHPVSQSTKQWETISYHTKIYNFL